jgi:hypothetical protein
VSRAAASATTPSYAKTRVRAFRLLASIIDEKETGTRLVLDSTRGASPAPSSRRGISTTTRIASSSAAAVGGAFAGVPGGVVAGRAVTPAATAAAGRGGGAVVSYADDGARVGASSSGASNVNAGAALRSKLSGLENAQQTAARTVTLSDGRIRYYKPEVASGTPGPTRGASFVTEWNPTTNNVRQWMESYGQGGNVVRVHPKTINGQQVIGPHFPPTGAEVGR